MRIAICDDEQIFLDLFKNKIDYLMKENNMKSDLFQFLSADDLLTCHNKNNFDAIFLDMNMPKTNGIELANIFRSINDNVIIIFVTSYSHFVYESII